MKENIIVGRLDFPNPPSVQLPYSPLSCGRITIPRNRSGGHAGMDIVELIWMIRGKLIMEYHDPPFRLELKAGQSTICLPNETRFFHNTGNTDACYRWICFDGVNAEKFIQSYGMPLRTALDSGECPEDLFKEAESLFLLNTPYAMRKLVSIITNIIALMTPNPVSPEVDRIFHLAISLISRNYRHVQFNINVLAETLNIHRTTLNRIFQANLQKSPHEYLTDYRLSQACFLLADNNLTVEEITKAVGFARSNYFCRIFARHFNQTPGNWRKQQPM
jgi:AraC-like DNA-binding protein